MWVFFPVEEEFFPTGSRSLWLIKPSQHDHLYLWQQKPLVLRCVSVFSCISYVFFFLPFFHFSASRVTKHACGFCFFLCESSVSSRSYIKQHQSWRLQATAANHPLTLCTPVPACACACTCTCVRACASQVRCAAPLKTSPGRLPADKWHRAGISPPHPFKIK